MHSNDDQRQKRILIVEPDSLLAAGLAVLLGAGRQLEGRGIEIRVIGGSTEEWAGILETYCPHLIVVPRLDFQICTEVQLALQKRKPVPRVVRLSPAFNEALVQDQTSIWLGSLDDLLALIP